MIWTQHLFRSNFLLCFPLITCFIYIYIYIYIYTHTHTHRKIEKQNEFIEKESKHNVISHHQD